MIKNKKEYKIKDTKINIIGVEHSSYEAYEDDQFNYDQILCKTDALVLEQIAGGKISDSPYWENFLFPAEIKGIPIYQIDPFTQYSIFSTVKKLEKEIGYITKENFGKLIDNNFQRILQEIRPWREAWISKGLEELANSNQYKTISAFHGATHTEGIIKYLKNKEKRNEIIRDNEKLNKSGLTTIRKF